jgi:hypothetical protein
MIGLSLKATKPDDAVLDDDAVAEGFKVVVEACRFWFWPWRCEPSSSCRPRAAAGQALQSQVFKSEASAQVQSQPLAVVNVVAEALGAADAAVVELELDTAAADAAAGTADEEEEPTAVIFTAAQFAFSSCSRLYHTHPNNCTPMGKSLGTVKLNACPPGPLPFRRCGQFPS